MEEAEGSEGLQPVSVEVPEGSSEGGGTTHAHPLAAPGEQIEAEQGCELPVTVKPGLEPDSRPEEEEEEEGFSSLSAEVMDLNKPRVITEGEALR